MKATMARQKKKESKVEAEDEVEGGTTHVRLADDLVKMLREVIKFQKMKTPKITAQQVLDPLLRPQLTRMYEEIRERSERIQKILEEG